MQKTRLDFCHNTIAQRKVWQFFYTLMEDLYLHLDYMCGVYICAIYY